MRRAIEACVLVAALTGCAKSPAAPDPVTTPPPQPSPAPAASSFTLRGTVRDAYTGRGIAAATVAVRERFVLVKSAVTDQSGAYTIGDLPGGTFSVSALANDYDSPSQTVTLSADAQVDHQLTPRIRAVEGRITDAGTGVVLSNVLVVLTSDDVAGLLTRTDATGRYRFERVPSRLLTLTATADTYVVTTRTIPAGGDVRVDLVLPRASGPQPPPPFVGQRITVRFDNVGAHDSTFGAYDESGVRLAPAPGSTPWKVARGGGYPSPYIFFASPAAGVQTEGEISVTIPSRRFRFRSVDAYSSTTRIPWTFTGLSVGNTVFTASGEQSNTFGTFATVLNPEASTIIDALRIRVVNPPTCCAGNPVGVDNIVLEY